MDHPEHTRSGDQVTVVIPTFNRAADLERALDALARQTARGIHVIVIDNSSTDDTETRVRARAARWDGRLDYLRKAPQGPASARNAGLALARTPFVLFHDSDIELADSWIERALAHLAAGPDLAAVGGNIVYAFDRGRVNAYGGDIGLTGLAWDVGEGERLEPGQRPADRIWINCSAMLVRSDAVAAAGAFDEAFFYGYEDSDLGWRLNLAGHRVRVFPDLCAVHHVDRDPGAAHPRIVFHYCKNRLRSVLRNASRARLPLMLAAYAAYSLADLLLRSGRRPKLRAIAWNVARLGETRALRRDTQARRVVPDARIFDRGGGRWLPPTPLAGRRRRGSGAGASGHDARDADAAVDDRV